MDTASFGRERNQVDYFVQKMEERHGNICQGCLSYLPNRPGVFPRVRFSSRHQVQFPQKFDLPLPGLVQSSERDECSDAGDNSRSIWTVTKGTNADVAMPYV